MHADKELQSTLQACKAGNEPCVAVVVLTLCGSRETSQGAALPGVVIALLLAALKGSGCSSTVAVRDGAVSAALEQFGYSAQSVL
jgi:hypothetical protein